ncbi:anaphase-promoting complex subunit 8 [Angomonas deanei]|uniref:Tetratricopeptide repeat/TPR repeat, putative n=1 Tax=Angomonas deanei TaxID=59799 RepID=A0A7G2CK09_9TRYP|nr:anaphase-promoting complex subunit 8 [Angomonas deanei]CAD2219224.1 Tetratricopeptide repeat/TPR repeat, putative [Angomonas deanei]|eukprot:EPY21665.1 anaphase-promoting complex subunit 8 [Angomonas deanei]
MSISLFVKQEYQRCYALLSRALRECDGSHKKEEEEDVGKNGLPDLSRQNHTDNRERAGRRAIRVEDVSLSATTFASTPLPSDLQFLCCYVLYLDGQKNKQTSSNPQHTYNPHLKILQSMLTEALRNPVNTISENSRTNVVEGHKRQRESDHDPSTAEEANPTSVSSNVSNVLVHKDPYLCWLLGVVLRDLGLKQEAASYLIAAVRRNPLLWCAWEDLATLVTRETQLREMEELLLQEQGEEEQEGPPRESVHQKFTFMIKLFLSQLRMSLGVVPEVTPEAAAELLRLYQVQDNDSPNPKANHSHDTMWEVLLTLFPRSNYILSQLAGYHYHHRKDLPLAEQLYAALHRRDPHYLECTPDYSNVLFMLSKQVELGDLAQRVYQVDPFRAESNFVVGNYYVFLGQHERSVLHFRRATVIQPTFVAAWTLLGHAYVETKNSAAAVEAYKTVVDIDPRDYRGWYNLGQIYELLQAYPHALYYYWHTTSLRPSDPRMWAAVANCLEQDGRHAESVACLERAELFDSPSSEVYAAITRRIATYYIDRRHFSRACVYLHKLIKSRSAGEDDLYFALPFLVQHYLLQGHRLAELPARSPSYDPMREVEDGQNNNNNDNSLGKGDPRLTQALEHIHTAQRYLETLSELNTSPGSTVEDTEGKADGSTKEETCGSPYLKQKDTNNRMALFIAQMRNEIAVNERSIRQKMA